jgi:hypothetical protein
MGKILIIVGVIMVVSGVIIQYSDRIPFLGKLPGDITFEKGNVKVFFPLATSILISLLLSLIFYLFNRFKS